MDALAQSEDYISGLPELKRGDMRALVQIVLEEMPGCQQRFWDGTDENGKVVANPTIGFGSVKKLNAKRAASETFQVGLSANKNGISVYLFGAATKTALARAIAQSIGKATVTGYCVRFKTVGDINLDAIRAAIRLVLNTQRG